MAKSKAKTCAAGRAKKPAAKYPPDAAQTIDHLLALHALQGTLLQSLRKALSAKPPLSQSKNCPQ